MRYFRFVKFELTFNYPISLDSLKNSVKLISGLEGEKLAGEFDTNKAKTIAYINIPVKKVLEKERFIRIDLNKDATSINGKHLSYKTHYLVTVPSIYNYFSVKKLNTLVVPNRKQALEQIINLKFNIKTDPEEVLQNIDVYLLPAQHPLKKTNSKANYKWKFDEINPVTLEHASKIDWNYIEPAESFSAEHNFKIDEPSDRYLYVVLKRGLKSYADYALAKDYKKIIKIPKYKKELKVVQWFCIAF